MPNNGKRTYKKREKSELKARKETRQLIKKTFRDYVPETKIKKLVDKAVKLAEKDDAMLRFVLEHVLGKAPQPIETPDDKPIMIKLDL
jgi:hypothetical protein